MPRILDGEAVDLLLTPGLALNAMRELFSLSGDTGYGRVDVRHPQGWLRLLPAFVEELGVFGYKTLNRANGVGMRYGIHLHDLATGGLVGIVDGLAVTNLRTGAVTALGAELLAPAVSEAAIIGTGQVARGQVVALQLVRPVERLRVYARSPQRRRAFVKDMAGELEGEIVDAPSLTAAVDGAGMITLATNATEPVIGADLIAPGVHVNSVGPASRDRVELDPTCFGTFDHIVCDSRDLVFDEAGDAHRAVEAGFEPSAALDLSDALREPPDRRPEQRTLFKSVGTGLQDLAVAARLLEAAARQDIGRVIPDYLTTKPFGSPG